MFESKNGVNYNALTRRRGQGYVSDTVLFMCDSEFNTPFVIARFVFRKAAVVLEVLSLHYYKK